ncbi:MAG TPA: DASS family sodium-coupled anion symporter [Vicinamibacterales bacterium]|jgi:DASS family divalent anion:Na+ symporter|nr:DASS family sodium-coupled anion symporter [Vicinamibacterales bacterium]
MATTAPTPPPVRVWGLVALLALYLVIAYLVPRPDAITPQGWRTAAIFGCVIVGMIIEPLPASALVLLGLTAMTANGTTMREALGGFAEPSVWLVIVAMLIARSMLDSGLARRIALVFIRGVGRSSLGISYALLMTDVTLASGVPSITARSAGMLLPIARRIAELFDSHPGPTAGRIGTFLVAGLYQGSAVACAMFFTGQASNVLGANLAGKLVNVEVTWASWLVAAIVPGLASCAVVPWVVHRVVTPSVIRTPEAPAFAAAELHKMGTLSRDERITLAVFVGVGLLWITTGWHRLDVTFIALLGLGVLLTTGAMTWSTATTERAAWDVFVWYGGLLRMGELLNATGTTKWFAESVGAVFAGIPWLFVLLGILIIYFYTHYAFASITAHVLAMFPPFVVLLVGLGVPPKLAVYSLLCLANLPAGLTHYGTTTGPILFGVGYVSFADWWRVGFMVSLANMAIWLTIGFGWWKLLGFW